MKKQIMIALLMLISYTGFVQAVKLEILKLRENFLKAIAKNDIDTVKEMLEKIDSNGINNIIEKETGNTPYHTVIYESDKFDIMPYLELFYKKGLDINKKDAEGYTPLHLAIRLNQSPKIVKFFTDKGATIDTKNSNNESLLETAKYAKKEIKDMIKDLQTKNADKIELQKIKKELNDNSRSYGMNKMIFKFAPDKDQKNFKAYTDTKELYTIATYTGNNGDVHYTIEYYNPFDKRSFYNKRGFIEPRPISKKEYAEKKNAIKRLWNDENEQFRIIRISHYSYPKIKYICGQNSISKDNDDTYTTLSGSTESSLNNPGNCAYIMERDATSSKWKKDFDLIDQAYNQQQRLLKKLHKEWEKKQPKEEFKKAKEVPTDIVFNYA